MSKFLSGLSPTLRFQVQDQILEGDSILTLMAIFSSVLRVSIGADIFSAPSIEQSVMISGCGRGRDHCCYFGGRELGLMEADRVPMRKDPGNVGIIDALITSLRNAGRNLVDLSGHIYLILVLLTRVVFFRVLHLLFLTLPRLYCRMRSMVDSNS